MTLLLFAALRLGIRNRAFAGTATDGTVLDITIAGLVLGSAMNKRSNRHDATNGMNAIRSETKAAGPRAARPTRAALLAVIKDKAWLPPRCWHCVTPRWRHGSRRSRRWRT
jgi:hypothetical protein